MQTRIPLTLAHIQYATGAKRTQLDGWLDQLVLEGVLDLEVSGDGEMTYSVRGAQRARGGPSTFAEMEKNGRRKPAKARAGDVDLARQALALANQAQQALTQKSEKGDKSLALSAGFSLLGPVGWFYAAPIKEAAVATVVTAVAWHFLPSFILMPLLMIGLPLSAVLGLIYAWQFNKHGERRPLLFGKADEENPGTKKKE
jgi:hypothetical protein